MLEKIADLILKFLELFRFCIVIDQYECAVQLRLGVLKRELFPGFHWIIPLGIDKVITDVGVPTAKDLPSQLLTLSDGSTVAIGPVITYKTNNPIRLLLECDNAEAALIDAARAQIGSVVMPMNWEWLSKNSVEASEQITKAVRKIAWKWGIEVLQVGLADLAKVKAIRLITGE